MRKVSAKSKVKTVHGFGVFYERSGCPLATTKFGVHTFHEYLADSFNY